MNVTAIGWALIHSLWQGAIVAVALAVVLTAMRGASPHLRYTASAIALALTVLLPVASAMRFLFIDASLAPAVQLSPADTDADREGDRAVTQSAPVSQSPSSSASPSPSPSRSPSPSPSPSPSVSGERFGAGTAAALRAIDLTQLRTRLERWIPWLVGFWLTGVLLLSARLFGGLARMRRLTRSGTPTLPERVVQTATEIAQRMGVTRVIRVLATAQGQVPLVIGWLRPVILVPLAALNSLTPAQLELILAHEIAHIRRADYVVNLLQTIAETLFFYHPAVWWMSSVVRDEREHCCDDLALEVCDSSARVYAGALLALEERRVAPERLAAAATGGSLLARVRRLLSGGPVHVDLGARWAAGVLGILAAAFAAGGLRPASPAEAGIVVPERFDPKPAETQSTPAVQDSAGAKPSRVIRYDGSGPLAERWRWALQRAADERADSLWIGYVVRGDATAKDWLHIDRRIPVRMGGNIMMGTFRFGGGSDELNKMTFSGTPLTPMLEEHAPYDIAVFIGVRGARSPRIVRIHAGSFAFPVYFSRWPLVWLGRAEERESIQQLSSVWTSTSSTELREDLVSIVGSHPTAAEVVPRLIAIMDDDRESGDVRRQGAHWLGRHGDRRALTALSRVARSDEDESLRQEAVEGLGHFPMAAAGDTLIAMARTLPQRRLKREAIEAMGHREEPHVFDALVAMARGADDRETTKTAVESIGNSLDERRWSVLKDLARNEDRVDVRAAAVETIGDADNAGDLVSFLMGIARQDRDESVRKKALEALGGIEDPRAVAALATIAESGNDIGVQRSAVEALGEAHPHEPAQEALKRIAWRHPEAAVQQAAVEAFSQFDDPRVIPLLAEIAERHPNVGIQRAAAETLGEAHPHEPAIEALRHLVWEHGEEKVIHAAVEALGSFDEKRSNDLLMDIAKRHPRPSIRRAALDELK